MSEAEKETATLVEFIPDVNEEFFVSEFANVDKDAAQRRAIGRELLGRLSQ